MKSGLLVCIFVCVLILAAVWAGYCGVVRFANAVKHSRIELAVSSGDRKTVERLIDRGTARTRFGNGKKWTTLLHIASRNRDAEVMRILLSNGADPNQLDSHGRVPLVRVIQGTDDSPGLSGVQCSQMLLDAGAKIEIGDQGGWTPLFFAVVHEDVDTVKWMLRSGANVNATDAGQNTPLHIACDRKVDNCRASTIIADLVSCGADSGSVNRDGDTAAHLFAKNNMGIELETIVSLSDKSSQNNGAECLQYGP